MCKKFCLCVLGFPGLDGHRVVKLESYCSIFP